MEIIDICDEIKSIRVNLVKLSKVRRTKILLENKLQQTQILYDEYILKRKELEIRIGKGDIKEDESLKLFNICDEIERNYKQIVDFCIANINVVTMAEFDVKTAASLLPAMTGEEDVTKKLIDALEFYRQTLNDSQEQLLINFVLKTRLSESAKLRLNSSYKTCTELILDMKKHLLTKQSATALQVEMMKTRQGCSTIEDFGKKLEDLFVKLTISQAGSDERAYQILRPLNEKLAVKRFTEGLRNSRLSTILAARDYTHLKDVIGAAKDEESSRAAESSAVDQGVGSICVSQHNRGKSLNFYKQRGSYYNRGQGRARNIMMPPRSNQWQGTVSRPPRRGSRQGPMSSFRGRGYYVPGKEFKPPSQFFRG